MLRTLPIELRREIAKGLIPPPSATTKAQHELYRTLTDNMELLSASFRDLKQLSMTCSDMQVACRDFLAQGILLHGRESHSQFLADLDGGRLSPERKDAGKTRFLSFGSPGAYDGSKYSLDRIFLHFCSITTLDLAKVHINTDLVYALRSMQALRTLSVRDPDTDAVDNNYVDWRLIKSSLPPVEGLSLVVSNVKACYDAGRLLKLFDTNLTTLSIRSEDGAETHGRQNFMGEKGLYLETANYEFKKLKHISFGFFKFQSGTLREFLLRCKDLESLTVDCRGVDGFLPIFYILDLVKSLMAADPMGTDLMESSNLWKYDWMLEELYEEENLNTRVSDMDYPYRTDAKIWTRCIESFSCVFAASGPATSSEKTVKDFGLVLATWDGCFQPLNMDMHFCELLHVFEAHVLTFRALEAISIAVSDDVSFKTEESAEQIQATISEMRNSSLASVKKWSIDWWQLKLQLNFEDPIRLG